VASKFAGELKEVFEIIVSTLTCSWYWKLTITCILLMMGPFTLIYFSIAVHPAILYVSLITVFIVIMSIYHRREKQSLEPFLRGYRINPYAMDEYAKMIKEEEEK
jgi:hypothetical protein